MFSCTEQKNVSPFSLKSEQFEEEIEKVCLNSGMILYLENGARYELHAINVFIFVIKV